MLKDGVSGVDLLPVHGWWYYLLNLSEMTTFNKCNLKIALIYTGKVIYEMDNKNKRNNSLIVIHSLGYNFECEHFCMPPKLWTEIHNWSTPDLCDLKLKHARTAEQRTTLTLNPRGTRSPKQRISVMPPIGPWHNQNLKQNFELTWPGCGMLYWYWIIWSGHFL